MKKKPGEKTVRGGDEAPIVVTSETVSEVLGRPLEQRVSIRKSGKQAIVVSGTRSLADVKEELTTRSAEIVSAALAFSEIDPSAPAPPAEWVERYGEEGAMRRWRIAVSSWATTKDAPVGVALAKSVLVGIIKADAIEKTPPAQLNVAVQMNLTPKSYPEEDVE